MDGVGEVDGGRARRHIHDVALRGKDEYLVREQIDLDVLDEVLSLGVLLCFEQLADPREGLLARLLIEALLVLPVRRNAVFRHLVHLGRADLDFERNARAADDGRVERLIAVRLRGRDIVLEATRNGLVEVVHVAEHVIAVRNRVHDDAHRADVVDFVDGLVLRVHLAVDGVDVLDAGGDGIVDMRLGELCRNALLNALEELLVLLALRLQSLDDLVIADGVEDFERKILKLPLDAAHAESMGDRRVDLHGFERLVALLALREILECARVMQAVGELDEDNADVLCHGEEHLAQILELLLLLGVAQHSQSGNTVHQLRDRRAELVFDFLVAELGVLDAVMQEGGADGVGIETHLDHDLRDRDRMDDIRLAVAALLPLMGGGGALVGGADLLDIGLRVLFAHPLEQKFQFVLHSLFPHSLTPPCFAVSAERRSRKYPPYPRKA